MNIYALFESNNSRIEISDCTPTDMDCMGVALSYEDAEDWCNQNRPYRTYRMIANRIFNAADGGRPLDLHAALSKV